MSFPFVLSLANGQQVVNIPGGVNGPLGLILAATTPPAAGTVTAEYQLQGQSTWTAFDSGTNQSLTAPVALFAYGVIGALRFTISGISGGAGLAGFVTQVGARGFPANAFEGLRALNVQTYIETNVKLGAQFYVQRLLPLIAAGASYKIRFTTGALPVLIKGRDLYASAQNLAYSIFKNPTGVSGGSALPAQNYNDINPVASTVTITEGVTATGNGTAWGDAVPLYNAGSAAQRVGSGLAPGGDRVLKPSTSYLVVVTNNDTSALTFAPAWFLTWYEGAPDLPRP